MNKDSHPTPVVRSIAEVTTPHAERNLRRLCKHFQHKLTVTYDERSGEIAFPMGECRLDSGDGLLKLSLAAPDEAQMDQLKDVVGRHLIRMASREAIQIDWRSV